MNYKALNTDFEEEKFSLKEWIWDHCPYWFRKFIRKFRRWWKYTVHLWKAPPWNEDYELFRIIQLQLSIMANEFERNQITMSAPQDAKDMRTVITLLDRYMEEYYSSKYWEEGVIKKELKGVSIEEFTKYLSQDTEWRPGYSDEGWHNSMRQDKKCLDIAMKLIAHKSPGWWQ